jgi:peptidoglycan/LPS O-acetylase OafA/YrhL
MGPLRIGMTARARPWHGGRARRGRYATEMVAMRVARWARRGIAGANLPAPARIPALSEPPSPPPSLALAPGLAPRAPVRPAPDPRRFLRDLPLRYGRITGSRHYVPQIDGLRFLAIAPVLIWHGCIRAAKTHPEIPVRDAVAWLPHGHAGVDLFFLISGYIIAWPFLAGHPPRIAAFFQRRVMRLEPPYILAMTAAFLALLVTGYHPSPSEALSWRADISISKSFFASLAYLHALAFGAPSIINPPAWSLEVEIQFYLLSPLLIALYRRGSPGVRRVVGAVLVGALLVGACLLDARFGRYGLHRWTLLGHGAPFLAGIVLCDIAIARGLSQAAGDRRGDALFAVGLVLWLGSALFWIDDSSGLAIGLARDTARTIGIVLVATGGLTGRMARALLARPWITFVGGMCYSIYLVHIMAMQAGFLVLARILPHVPLGAAFVLWCLVLSPIALASGLTFYLLVERPCMMPDWPLRAWQALRGRHAA